MHDERTSVDRPTGRDGSAFEVLVPTHLKSTRRSWIFVLVAVATVFSLVQAARTLARMRSEVVPGVYYNLKLRVIAPLPEAARAAGIGFGDRIASVDDRQFDDAYALSAYLRGVGLDHPVRVEAVRGAHAVTADLVTFAPSWATAWLELVVGTTFALLGIAVFWFHPGRRESWPFLFGCVAWGVAILSGLGAPRTTQTALQSQIGLVAYAMTGPLLLHLFAVFPRPLRVAIHRPRLLIAMDAIALALGCAVAALQPTTVVALGVTVIAAIDGLALIATVAIVVWRVRRPAPPEDRTRLRAVIVAVVLAFPVPAILTLVRVLGYVPATYAMRWVAHGTSVLFPLLVGYAIVRHDLLEIDRAVVRAAATSAIVGVAALVAAGLAIALPVLVAPAAVVGSPSAMAIVVLGGVAMLWPVKRRLQRALIDRFGHPDVDDQLAAAREALAELAETASPALFGRFERRLEEIARIDDVAVLVPEGTAWRRPATGETVTRTALGGFVELRLADELVGALAFGRRGELSRRAKRIVDALSPEVARALVGGRSGDRIGDYQIDRFVAAGGMGNVYVGRKVGAGGFVKEVAIKQLLPELAVQPEIVDRFLKEARLVARLSHPGIVQTLELGQAERGYF